MTERTSTLETLQFIRSLLKSGKIDEGFKALERLIKDVEAEA